MVKINESLKKVLDVAQEEDIELLEHFAKNSKKGDVFLSMIAPYVGVKISPSRVATASIGLSEEFGIESVLEQIKKKRSNDCTLYLLINSPGGLVTSSYKVTRALRKSFKNIIVFVPHIAASGGTLVALTGNKIVMGMMSQITPLDPQTGDKSVNNVVRGFETITQYFETTSEKDAPYSYKILAQKYDAIELDKAISNIQLMKKYIREILENANYKKDDVERIANKLVTGFYTHSDVIHFDEAKSINLNVVPNTEYAELWDAFRDMLGKYVLESADKHILRYWVNDGELYGKKNNGKIKKN
ncbi:MAG: ATP-dependent Clp protease proteolytic subunit [Candidatus Micrarchaeota archaeon]|nr:ATP-dependent Clp protease proteolytic subunit [Candidatus Micrarchaeota archaeon]